MMLKKINQYEVYMLYEKYVQILNNRYRCSNDRRIYIGDLTKDVKDEVKRENACSEATFAAVKDIINMWFLFDKIDWYFEFQDNLTYIYLVP